ncbi:zinc-dependent alcohol dehydrogenase family protein [Ruegeria sp. MALMAid1280]|uniref:zinc-dependent alcohol dehydrogenase family protein n=1 Tax=Ruegeria sp. MALMAid1280 TaxID=3411634 RepID=UPI003BA2C84C
MNMHSGEFNAYSLSFEDDDIQLSIVSEKPKPPASDEVRIAIGAASLNYRDLLVRKGQDSSALPKLAPLSDGAGEIVEIGDDVSDWKVGDRVVVSFFPNWERGRFSPPDHGLALGGNHDGVAAEQITIGQGALVRIPNYLSFAQASTLPCAAVTAWGALFERSNPITSGDIVLIQGTGGVAIFGLQLAKAVGAKVIALSSSDEKLEQVKTLGADIGINYRKTPNWAEAVREATNGHGADHILELGGVETFEQSIAAVAGSGVISQIGVLTGFGPQPNLHGLLTASATINGILVGPRAYLENLVSFLEEHRIEPVVDKEYAFGELEAAYEHLESGAHIGKVVISV